MSVLPSYFEYRIDCGDDSDLYSFMYDDSVQQFVVAGKTIAAEDFDPYTFNSYELKLNGNISPLDYDDMPNHAVLLPGHGAIIAGPKLHEWAANNPGEVTRAAKMMHKLFTSLVEDPEEIPSSEGGFMGFASSLREGGGLHFQVFGNCACMGPDPCSGVINGQFEAGFVEYSLHNADSQVQRASLYAGIGHLARLARGLQPAQLELFESR